MVKRILAEKLKFLSRKYPVVCVLGPRQSGKTTLVKAVFPHLDYVNLENLDSRQFAVGDPRAFLAAYPTGVIIDEAQRAPDLFSYIQTESDKRGRVGQFVLTGSQNILLQQNISQSLAGRAALLKLLPFSLEELKNSPYHLSTSEKYILRGFYPRLYDKKLAPSDWYPGYVQSYVEKDLRLIKNITDLAAFQKFLKMCAGRIGQVLNLSSLGNDCGITHNTAKAWLSVLEASYIVFLLQPYYKNFNKRLIKCPKLYFYDTGLACFLLGIQSEKQLLTHYLHGGLFESFVISEIIKHSFGRGREHYCYFWRDRTGHEIDCVMERPEGLLPVEIKSGKTVNEDYFNGLKYWAKLTGKNKPLAYVVYNGEETQKRSYANVVAWKDVGILCDEAQ